MFCIDPQENIVPESPNSLYHRYDSGSAEVEVCEFLSSLIRLLKPDHVLESGSYKGISSSYIASALKENTYGHLDTIEFNPILLQESRERWKRLFLDGYITSHEMSSLDFQPSVQYDFMFLDTEVNIRLKELVRFYPFLNPGGYVVIHDMPPSLCQGNINTDHPEIKHWPLGEIPTEVTQWVKDGELRPMFFPNPRGMMMLYKPRLDEHQWI